MHIHLLDTIGLCSPTTKSQMKPCGRLRWMILPQWLEVVRHRSLEIVYIAWCLIITTHPHTLGLAYNVNKNRVRHFIYHPPSFRMIVERGNAHRSYLLDFNVPYIAIIINTTIKPTKWYCIAITNMCLYFSNVQLFKRKAYNWWPSQVSGELYLSGEQFCQYRPLLLCFVSIFRTWYWIIWPFVWYHLCM